MGLIGSVRTVGGRVVALAAVCACLIGCSSGIPRYDITVTLDESLRLEDGAFPSLDVDIVGDRPEENSTWTGYPVTRYFSGQDTGRTEAVKHTLSFEPAGEASQSFEASNEVWKQWQERGTDTLFVMAHLPGAYSDLHGEQDPRRVILPLARERWNASEILISINKTGASLRTPRRPAR